jgi:protein SCO1/2/putative membrane protein
MKRICVGAVLLVLLPWAAAPAGVDQGQAEYDSLHQTIGAVPDFKLTDQNGNVVQREQMLGKVCVVSVFFSCCTTFCPITQHAMEGLQGKLAGYPDVLLVSINVFPGHDTGSIIADYARDHHADPARWLFLHGGEKEIYDLVQGGFKQGLARNTAAGPGLEVTHPPTLLVVDHRGVIRGYVDGRNPEQVERLEKFVKQLVQAKYLPSVNAGLNGACGVLLVLGFVFIRLRWIAAHKVFMLMALAVSALFLGCYLYYHFAVLDGTPTHFTGEGPVRWTYLTILLSHTLLAALVAPLALRVTYLGLRNRLAGHVRLARWTLPIWLYVSITGVIVYWMLYHLYPPV